MSEVDQVNEVVVAEDAEESAVGTEQTIQVERIAKGGKGIGVSENGKTIFVEGSIPGESVEVKIVSEKKSFLDSKVSKVLTASEHRVEPVCSHVNDGCGGCDWQHISGPAQNDFRVDIVKDSLRRLGNIEIDHIAIKELPPLKYRTTVNVAVRNGKAAYRVSNSHDLVDVSQCSIAHPLVEEILVHGRFGTAKKATIRASISTGERYVLVDQEPENLKLPNGVKTGTYTEIKNGRKLHIHEEVNGSLFRVSARSFFQARPDGAGVLADLVNEALVGAPEGPMLDAYCGVGLFGVLCGEDRKVSGVESSKWSISDARQNYKAGDAAIHSDFEKWRSSPFAVVVADPARVGLKSKAVRKLLETKAHTIVLISCDPASLARDASLLEESGYELKAVTVVDMFSQTSHVETVSKFVKV